jgi:hypothetical protein
MQILFSDKDTVDLTLASTPLAVVYQKIYKHLCHVPIPFNEWDNPYYVINTPHQELVNKLIFYANQVSVQIDQSACMSQDQQYFNTIHEIYEKNYNGDPAWLNFHEHIHLCEKNNNVERYNFLHIDYREKSGMLERPFDFDWLRYSTTKIKAGDVFVRWAELGKTPYTYWKNGEPNDSTRMCELIKPWLVLKPKMCIALEDIDTLKNIESHEFESWWKQYSEIWCRHWNIPAWTLIDIFSAVIFGKVEDFEKIKEKLKNSITPTKILQ